jgi:hypothetical protein
MALLIGGMVNNVSWMRSPTQSSNHVEHHCQHYQYRHEWNSSMNKQLLSFYYIHNVIRNLHKNIPWDILRYLELGLNILKYFSLN